MTYNLLLLALALSPAAFGYPTMTSTLASTFTTASATHAEIVPSPASGPTISLPVPALPDLRLGLPASLNVAAEVIPGETDNRSRAIADVVDPLSLKQRAGLDDYLWLSTSVTDTIHVAVDELEPKKEKKNEGDSQQDSGLKRDLIGTIDAIVGINQAVDIGAPAEQSLVSSAKDVGPSSRRRRSSRRRAHP